MIVDEIAQITREIAAERSYTLVGIHALTAQHPEWFAKDGVQCFMNLFNTLPVYLTGFRLNGLDIHNTITPIARRRGEAFELDLVLRCNITSKAHPLSVFHPHADKHHIKKENIGLIEVMGLAVLPSRLKQELADLAEAAWMGKDISGDETLRKHDFWLAELKQKYTFTQENALDIIQQETGKVFAAVLEDAGVYKCSNEGRTQFYQFVDHVNQK